MAEVAQAAEIKAKDVVEKTLNSLSKSPNINLSEASAKKIKGAVVREMTSVIVNQTNTEPWYQSRVTWGAIGAVVLPLLGLIGVSSELIEPDEFVALGVAAGTVLSGLVTLYGRWVAKKPIGE